MVRKIVLTHNLGDQLVGQFAETDGLGTDATLNEAIEYGFVTSIQKESLLAYIQGVFKAMIRGVESDGNGRKIDGFVSINPFARGRLDDICDEYTKSVAHVVAICRMLKAFDVDTSGWQFVIEGSTGNLVVNIVTTGEEVGVVRSGEDIMINGLHLAGASVGFELPDGHHYGIAPEYVTSDETRVTVDKDGLADLAAHAQDGDVVKFKVTVGTNRGYKSAVYKVVA